MQSYIRQLAIDILDVSFKGTNLGSVLIRAVRVCCHWLRTRWSACNACCSDVFTGTG